MNPRRWWWRLGLAVALFAVLEVTFVATQLEPDALRLGLLVALGFATLGLVLDALADTGPSWAVDAVRPVSLTGQDPRTGRNLSLLEGHVTARVPDGALQDRLVQLADLVLRQHHGVDHRTPEGLELLGPEVATLLTGPPEHRLSPTDIDRCISRIEEL
ncbi:MAG: hypothetical protein JWN22_2911 [Nocardioides sp.]|nr:hypothetical protein [Nocardioides sp.]